MRFAIWAPGYAERSAGISALHRLCHWLTVLGHDAGVTTPTLHPHWETKTWSGGLDADTIAVYPEIVAGNPLKARKIVRWALCYPGWHYFRSPETFEACDLAFHYADKFEAATTKAWGGRQSQRLMVSVFPEDTFYPWDGPRSGDLYYVGRGGRAWSAYQAKGAPGLNGAVQFPGNYPTRYDVAKALRRAKRVYMFDQVTALLAEAMLCGCETYIVDEEGEMRPCGPDSPEAMHVFEPGHAFSEPGDVLPFIEACAAL